MFIPYHRYVAVLKWLTVVLFAYVATVFIVHVPWGEALRSTLVPTITLSPAYLTGLIAVLGTTISPYLFFWQASEEAEEEQDNPREAALVDAPAQAPAQLKRIKLDTYTGMAFSNAVAFFIILIRPRQSRWRPARPAGKPAGYCYEAGLCRLRQAATAAFVPLAGPFTAPAQDGNRTLTWPYSADDAAGW
jgi:hypothetical protein